jgi:broad specificity phosphatase PhoE
LVCCRQENGTKPEFGLAPQGVEQARAAGEQLRKVPDRCPCLTAVDSWIGCAVVNL